MTEDAIKVLIIDDHAMMRVGLKTSLSLADDVEVVGESGDGAEAVVLCEQLAPDIVLMDLVMPGMSGIEAIAEIHRAYPSIQIIALTSVNDPERIRQAMQSGAVGYLLKDIAPSELVEAIRSVKLSGTTVLSPKATEALINEPRPQRSAAADHDLTEREMEVLELLAEGLSNAAIAERLTVSALTIKTHVSNIYSKLGVNNRTEAVSLALKNDLLQME